MGGLRHRARPTTVMLAAFAVSVTVGLAACGSSHASRAPTTPVSVAAANTTVAAQSVVNTVETIPATTSPVATSPVATDAVATTNETTPTTDAAPTVGEADVADMEKQLDEIDQLLAGVDSDLSQD